METQNKQILELLKSGKSITSIDALNLFGCFRLGARIHDIKREGYLIQTTIVRNEKKNFASYKLIN